MRAEASASQQLSEWYRRMANGVQQVRARIEDLDVQLVRLVHHEGYYLAVLTRSELPTNGQALGHAAAGGQLGRPGQYLSARSVPSSASRAIP